MLLELKTRSIIKLAANNILSYLNSLSTQKLDTLSPKTAAYACILTPNSKYLLDFFVYKLPQNEVIIDIVDSDKKLFIEKINYYNMDANLLVEELKDWRVYALMPDIKHNELTLNEREEGDRLYCYKDPRSDLLGYRVIATPKDNIIKTLTPNDKNGDSVYHDYLVANCIVGGEMLTKEKSFILEYNFEDYNAINYNKGCYIGQEMITRTKRVGEIRKKIYKGYLLTDRQAELPQSLTASKLAPTAIILNEKEEKVGHVVAINSKADEILVILQKELLFLNSSKKLHLHINENNAIYVIE